MSAKFGAKLPRVVGLPLLLEVPEFPDSTVSIKRSSRAKNHLSLSSRFDTVAVFDK